MRAVVHDRYGPPDVLRIEEVERPTPQAGELLVEVHASSVTRSDTGLRGSEYWFARAATGLRRPRQRIVGMEFAGVVAATGASVTRFRVGEEVFGIRSGANAEYVCVRERGVVERVPPGLTLLEAAAVADGACTAMAFLRQAGLASGHRLLVYGASGSIGTAAVQLGRSAGAHVTAVVDARHVELARSLGADCVIDRSREDFAAGDAVYDVLLDAVGALPPWRSRRSLAPGGIFLTAGSARGLPAVVAASLLTWRSGTRRVRLGLAEYRTEDLSSLRALIERGAYRAVIDRSFAFEDVVEAHRYVDTRQKAGNVALVIRPGLRRQ